MSLIRLIREAAWAPFMLLGLYAVMKVLLEPEPWYLDDLFHAIGGIAIAFFFHRACIIGSALLGRPTKTAILLITFGLSCTAALGWEFAEFWLDRFTAISTQPSLADTMVDLLIGTIAAGTYVLVVAVRRQD